MWKQHISVHVVNEDDIAAARFNISQVVLPLPGHDVDFPQTELGDKYESFIKQDVGMTKSDWKSSHIKYVTLWRKAVTKINIENTGHVRMDCGNICFAYSLLCY